MRRPAVGRAVAAGAVAVALALLAGCGVPTDDDARRIPAGDVPFDLLNPTPPAAPTTSAP